MAWATRLSICTIRRAILTPSCIPDTAAQLQSSMHQPGLGPMFTDLTVGATRHMTPPATRSRGWMAME